MAPTGLVATPTQPAEIGHVSLHALADGHHTHFLRLVEHHHGLGEPLTDEQVAAHAGRPGYQHALDQRALHSRWVVVREALLVGASLVQDARGRSRT